ncbi:RDD family protein [Nocardioides sp. GY 10127]|uniref:RDD family protein n=1 Tax=Nocardioides sp. GY 10127 TaxID=2569762 RepID=UPI0010A86A73|nr:RDD family protein [Nocardioides sp. GY 10127]TIC82946.1 RDD family protein [Nocardioides sp. GY 10127]
MPEAGGEKAGFLHRLAGGVTERVVSVVDPDVVLDQVDPNALLDRVDPNRLLDRVDPDRLLARVDPDALLDRVDPNRLLDRVDPDRLLERVDATALVRRVDLDAVLAGVDLDEVLARVDLDAVLARVDLEALLKRVDLDAVLDRVDPDRLLERVDATALVQRVDLDAVLAGVDLDAVMARVDLDAVLARVDLDAVLARVDLEAAVKRSGVPDLIADSTNQLAGSALDLARRQLVALDVIIDRLLGRLLAPLLRRDPAAQPEGPERLVRPEQPSGEAGARARRRSVTGHYAGAATRLVAAGLDVAAVTTSYTLAVAGTGFLSQVFLGVSFGDTQGYPPLALAALLSWAALYLFASLAIAGRTPGKALVGLRVVSADGAVLAVRQALVRTVAFPFSALLLGAGFVLGLLHPAHRTLHDLVAGTCEVYDWGERAAELPGPLSAFLERQGPDWEA